MALIVNPSECDKSTGGKCTIDDQSSPIFNCPPNTRSINPLSFGLLSQDQYNDAIREQIKLLIHVIKCRYSEPRRTNAVPNTCNMLECNNIESILNHISNDCTPDANCDFSSCKQTRNILSHWEQCTDPNCQICAADDIKKMSTAINKPVFFSQLKLNRKTVSKEFRDHSIRHLMDVIFAIVDTKSMFQKNYGNFQVHIKELEISAFQESNSLNNYKKLIDDKISNILKNVSVQELSNKGKNNNDVKEIIQQQQPVNSSPTYYNNETKSVLKVEQFVKTTEKVETELSLRANSRTEYYTLITNQNNKSSIPKFVPQNFPAQQNNLPQNSHYPGPNMSMTMNPQQIIPGPQMRPTKMHQQRQKIDHNQPVRMIQNLPGPYEYNPVMPLNNIQQNMVPQCNMCHHDAGSTVYYSAAPCQPMNWPHQQNQQEYLQRSKQPKRKKKIPTPNVSIDSQTKRLKKTDQKENIINISDDNVEDKKVPNFDLDLLISDHSGEIPNFQLEQIMAACSDLLTLEMVELSSSAVADVFTNNNNDIVNNDVNNNNTLLSLNELNKPIDQQHSPNDASMCLPKSHTSANTHQQSGNSNQRIFNQQEALLQQPHNQLPQFQQHQLHQPQQVQQNLHQQQKLQEIQKLKQDLHLELAPYMQLRQQQPQLQSPSQQQQQLPQQQQSIQRQQQSPSRQQQQQLPHQQQQLPPPLQQYHQLPQQQQLSPTQQQSLFLLHHHQQQTMQELGPSMQLRQQQQQQPLLYHQQQSPPQQQHHQQQQRSPQQSPQQQQYHQSPPQQQHHQSEQPHHHHHQQQSPPQQQLQFQNQINYSPTYPGQPRPLVNSPMMIFSPNGQDIRSPIQLSSPESLHHGEKLVNFLPSQYGKCGQHFPTFPNVLIN